MFVPDFLIRDFSLLYEANKVVIFLIRNILDRHTSYNVNDLKAPSSVIKMWSYI
jgi:hypothetical protein